MICEYCNYSNGHHPGCPNYEPPKTNHYCSICHEEIYDGEEYIVNDDGDYRHYDCFYGIRDLLEWLGYNVKTMEEIWKD